MKMRRESKTSNVIRMEEELSTYQQMQRILKRQVPLPQVKHPNGPSQVVKRWTMSKVDRIQCLENVHLSPADMEQDEVLPQYYYKSDQINPNIYRYQQNTKERKGVKGEREGKHTRAIKKGKFVIK